MNKLAAIILMCIGAGSLAAQTGEVLFSPATPRFPTSSIEFRDPTGKLWPCIWHGRCADENVVALREADASGAFTVKAEGESMLRYSLDKRVLGELLDGIDEREPDPEREDRTRWAKDVPMPTVRITGLTATAVAGEKKGGYSVTAASGTLELAGKTVALEGGSGTLAHRKADGAHVLGARLTFVLKGNQLGLSELADQDVELSIYSAGEYADGYDKGKKKRKKKR
ncbi:MAG: hypothetical protein ACOCZK_03565 [Planctomycetota bacterium]